MVLVGRITKNAVVNELKDERQVVNFSIAINDYYRQKGAGEPTKLTTFINCSYWISSKVARRLKKGTLMELSGRISVDVYTDMNGNAKGSLHCHVNHIKIHSSAKGVEVSETHVPDTTTENKKEDLPF